jgi:hypothetical protein
VTRNKRLEVNKEAKRHDKNFVDPNTVRTFCESAASFACIHKFADLPLVEFEGYTTKTEKKKFNIHHVSLYMGDVGQHTLNESVS